MNVVDEFISLHGGISNQDKFIRLPQQVEDSVNCHHDLATGLRRRNPTELINTDIGINSEAWTYVYDRGLSDQANEKYAISYDGSAIVALDLNTGELVPVNDFSSGYMSPFTSKTGYSAITVKDNIFITNRNKIIESIGTEGDSVDEGFLWLRRADPVDGYDYNVTVNYSYNDGANTGSITHNSTGKLSTEAAATDFANNLDDTYIDTVSSGNVCRIRSQAGATITSIIVSDSYGSLAISAFYKEVSTTNDLPSSMPYDTKVQVIGDDNTESNYWLESSAGLWKECVGDNATLGIDASTMPHQMIRKFDGNNDPYFDFEPITWDDRLVGDDDNAKAPSFINDQIVDVMFYKNRLGFLLPTGLLFSEVGSYYNFWKTTQVADLDSDRIDTTLDAKKAIKLHFAEFLQEDLIIFGDRSQFRVSNTGILSNKTIDSVLVSEYDFNYKVRPLALDDKIYFLASNGSHNALYRYAKTDISALNTAQCISNHCPELLDNSITDIVGSSSNSIIMMTSSENPNLLYVYKYLYEQQSVGRDSLVQSAWLKWRFEANINTVFTTESELYLLNTRFDRVTDVTYTVYNGVWNDDELWNDLYPWKDEDSANYSSLERMNLYPQPITEEYADLGTDTFVSSVTLTEYVPRAGETVRASDKVILKTIKVLLGEDSEADLYLTSKSRGSTRIVDSKFVKQRRLMIGGKPEDTSISIVSDGNNGFEISGVAYEASINNRNRTI
jgi:hypothetical protein